MPTRTQGLLVLVARILAAPAIVRYGFAKFLDTKVFIKNLATIGFMKAFFGESKVRPGSPMPTPCSRPVRVSV